MKNICTLLEIGRSWYYESLKNQDKVQEYEDMIVSEVRKIRAIHPYYGVRRLKHALARDGVCIGTHALRRILRAHDMMLSKRYRKVYTSILGVSNNKCVNLIKDLDITQPNQVLCTDITYILTAEGVIYTYAMMDMYSRMILSYYVSNNLRADSALICLKAALKNIDKLEGIIHHSDRGCQYTSGLYLDYQVKNGIQHSFTGEKRCYENAKMERFFNTLKHEYGLKGVLKSKKVAKELIQDAVDIYNNHRIHEALRYNTPAEVYNNNATYEPTIRRAI